MNESAEGAAVLPGAAHVGHMDTRVALQYHNITRVALRIIIGEFDRNVMEGLSLSNVMEGLPLVVPPLVATPQTLKLLALSILVSPNLVDLTTKRINITIVIF